MRKWNFEVREGTQDAQMVNEVFVWNAYKLPDDMKGWRVLDIGANIGAFAAACHVRGAGYIICYEPSRENYGQLIANAAPDVRVRNVAVWSSAGEMPFLAAPFGMTACHRIDSKGTRVANCATLDDILKRHGPFDLVKIDAEGAEYEILRASLMVGRQCKRVVGEAHGTSSNMEHMEMAEECYRLLRARGMHAMYGDLGQTAWFYGWNGSPFPDWTPFLTPEEFLKTGKTYFGRGGDEQGQGAEVVDPTPSQTTP